MVDIHHAPVIRVDHLRSSAHASSSLSSSQKTPHVSSSQPPQYRSTRDLSISNTSEHRRACNSMSSNDKKYDTVRIVAVTEKDFSQQDYHERISTYNSSMGRDSSHHKRISNPRDSESDELVQLLALQVYHLPGNTWCQDWWQYMANNHPVFGICLHHKLHPIGAKTRIVAMIGTVLFGLALTNMFYLFYLWNPEFDRVVAKIVTNSGDTIVLTTGMLLLWTLGGGVHCAFNLTMWHIAACACCRSGGFCESFACCPSLGKHMIRVFVLGILAMCIMIILLRVAINSQRDSLSEEELTSDNGDKGIAIEIDDQIDLRLQSVSQFSFLIGYLVEMTLTFFVYYPIGGTMLFSGMMACFYKIPILGGRPYELHCEEKRKSKLEGGAGVVRSINNGDSDF